MEGRPHLDVVVLESAAVLELLSSEDEALLFGRDALLVPDLGLHVLDGVAPLHIEADLLAAELLHEESNPSTCGVDVLVLGILPFTALLQFFGILESLVNFVEKLQAL